MSITKHQIVRISIMAICLGVLAAPLQAKKRGGGGGGAGNHMEKGIELAGQKQYDAAIVEFTKAIEAEPKDPRNYTNRGTAYRSAGKLPEAIADFVKAIEVAPKDYFGYMEKSRTE